MSDGMLCITGNRPCSPTPNFWDDLRSCKDSMWELDVGKSIDISLQASLIVKIVIDKHPDHPGLILFLLYTIFL